MGCWDLDVGSLRKPATQDRRLRTLADNLFDTLYATGLDLQWQASALETCMQHPLTTKAVACQATLNLIIKRLMIIVANVLQPCVSENQVRNATQSSFADGTQCWKKSLAACTNIFSSCPEIPGDLEPERLIGSRSGR